MGHQSDIPTVLKMIDIFVMTPKSETWPTILMEAMAAKRAIVSTNSGGGNEIIKNGETVILVPVGDSKAIAAKIEYLIEHLSKRINLSENAERESSKYDICLTGKKLEELFEKVTVNQSWL